MVWISIRCYQLNLLKFITHVRSWVMTASPVLHITVLRFLSTVFTFCIPKSNFRYNFTSSTYIQGIQLSYIPRVHIEFTPSTYIPRIQPFSHTPVTGSQVWL